MLGREPYNIKDQSVLTPLKSWLLGMVMGDGNVRFVPGKLNQVKVHAGTSREDAELIACTFDQVYGARATIKERLPKNPKHHPVYLTYCSWKLVLVDFLSLGTYGLTKWRVPEVVLASSLEVKGAFISGLADADGCVYFKNRPENVKKNLRAVFIDSINLQGLAQVSSMLNELKIEHQWTIRKAHTYLYGGKTVNAKESYKLRISFQPDLRRFRDLVGFRSPRKKAKLDALLESYERDTTRPLEVENLHLPEIKRRREAGETHVEIADSLNLLRETVSTTCYRHGIEPLGREGNAAGGTRSIGLGPVERKLPQIQALRAEGKTDKEIAGLLDLKNRDSVQSALKAAEEKGKIAKRGPQHKSRDLAPTIAAGRAAGKTWREIGESLSDRRGQPAAIWAMNINAYAIKKGWIQA